MGQYIKQGININLAVDFKDLDFETVDSIDFIFKQDNNRYSPALKESTYNSDGSGDCKLRSDTTIVEIPWTEEETNLFIPNNLVYMDTKIHIKDSTDNPITPIVSFEMNSTLFEEDDSNE